jgi:hypothetical protein
MAFHGRTSGLARALLRAAALVIGLGSGLAGHAAAQGTPPNPNHENDVALNNGVDLVYVYSDPSIGPEVGTVTPASCLATNDYFWKAYPREVMRSCSGSLEVSGIEFGIADGDPVTLDASGNNTALPDILITAGELSTVFPGLIVPDPARVLGQISFGDGGPGVNNIFVPWECACCPDAEFYYSVDVTIGTGAGDGITLSPADGSTDFVVTTFVPGGGMTFSGDNACMNGAGDGAAPDWHSSDVGGAIGETMADFTHGSYSPYGGFSHAGQSDGTDSVREVACVELQFFEPMLDLRCDSKTGMGAETGTNGLHLDTSPGNVTVSARIYAWQDIGQQAAVAGTLSPPLGSCLAFAGGKLGLDPGDPLFALLLGAWHSPPLVTQSWDGNPPTFTPIDDGTFTTPQLVVPALPVGLAVPLHFQGFVRKPGGGMESTQIWTTYLHG